MNSGNYITKVALLGATDPERELGLTVSTGHGSDVVRFSKHSNGYSTQHAISEDDEMVTFDDITQDGMEIDDEMLDTVIRYGRDAHDPGDEKLQPEDVDDTADTDPAVARVFQSRQMKQLLALVPTIKQLIAALQEDDDEDGGIERPKLGEGRLFPISNDTAGQQWGGGELPPPGSGYGEEPDQEEREAHGPPPIRMSRRSAALQVERLLGTTTDPRVVVRAADARAAGMDERDVLRFARTGTTYDDDYSPQSPAEASYFVDQKIARADEDYGLEAAEDAAVRFRFAKKQNEPTPDVVDDFGTGTGYVERRGGKPVKVAGAGSGIEGMRVEDDGPRDPREACLAVEIKLKTPGMTDAAALKMARQTIAEMRRGG